MRLGYFALFAGLLILACEGSPKKAPSETLSFISGTKQFIFAGKRAGEGYYSQDGRYLIYQSEAEPDNPFYQIYAMDLESGDSWRVTPGHGKSTCARIHPNNKKVMFSSTHHDPLVRKKQQDEIDFRHSGKTRRYSWDYDENYEIFEGGLKGGAYKKLTNARGYDADGSYSPDGKWIAFASNRHAYTEKLNQQDQERFAKDPAFMLDIYLMRADGSDVRRLTTSRGYDGGPFFSPDGQKIIWRRFAENDHTAEVYTMDIDGTNQKQITRLNVMSWAPYFHPSGDYIAFATNLHGYSNFEIYMVDAEGKSDPVRVTNAEGFDGRPVFSPNGKQLLWSKQPKGTKSAHLYAADWDDAAARKALGLPPAPPLVHFLKPEVDVEEIQQYVEYFASAEMNGRMTASPEEKIYTQKIASYFQTFGLLPIRGQKSMVVPFEYNAGGQLVEGQNQLQINGKLYALNKDWRPVSVSANGKFSTDQMAFVGYGLRVPEGEGYQAFDSYPEQSVKGKWVVMFRFVPESLEGKERVYFQRYSRLPFKIKTAADLGAKGVILVSGPNSNVKDELISWSKSNAGTSSIPVISVSDELAAELLGDLDDIQSKVDKKEKVAVSLAGSKLTAEVGIRTQKKSALSVVGMLRVPGAKSSIMIGAHGDHLGRGEVPGSSRATEEDTDPIHYGADDNASGMAGVMELAHYFADLKRQKKLKRNVYFAIWSGEEMGTLGSKAFVDEHLPRNPLAAYFNLDMIGRLKGELFVQGSGSAQQWPSLVQKAAFKSSLKIKLQQDPYLPTDTTPFYLAKVPGLSVFSGTHGDYHSPRDRVEFINFQGMVPIIDLVGQISGNVASTNKKITYLEVERQGKGGRRSFRIYLGTLPDYSGGGTNGLKLSGVIKGGPAEKGGLQRGDVIVEFGGKTVKTIYDYMYVLEMARPGKELAVTVLREGERVNLKVVPESKQ